MLNSKWCRNKIRFVVLDNKNNKIVTIAQGGVPVFQFFLKGYVLRVESDNDQSEDGVNFYPFYPEITI